MPVQTNLFPEPPSGPPHPQPSRREPPPRPPAASREPGKPPSVWLQRVSTFIFVIFCVYLGVILAIVPWWTAVWDHNALLQANPRLWAILRTGAARGIISGLGVLDIAIGLSEAVHYRDFRQAPPPPRP